MATAARNAARMLSRDGTPGVTAVPHTAFVPASTNHVTHGLTSWPPESTSTGASTWSASQTALRCVPGRCKNTS